MTQHAVQQAADFVDFFRGVEVREILQSSKSGLSDVRVSPDARHVHVMVRAPASGLTTCDKYPKSHLIHSPQQLDLSLTRSVPTDLLFFPAAQSEESDLLLGVIFENGKAEIWKFSERKSGWNLLQTVELCNSPRAKVLSVCISGHFIIWCEERPPSESSSLARSPFRYCICKRKFHVDDTGLGLESVRIALHNNPRYLTLSSADMVYLLPDSNERSNLGVSKVFLSWSPQLDVYKVHSACTGTILSKQSTGNKQCDFKRLLTDCIGLLATMVPPDICSFCPAQNGGLLLLLSSGWICMLQRDGCLRQIYKLPDNCLPTRESSLNIYGDVIALAVARVMYLVDVKCGIELDRISLKEDGILFVSGSEPLVPHILMTTGLFTITEKEVEAKIKPSGSQSKYISSGMVDAVFEEACSYYQQRSVSTTQLTAEKLKKGGMFQAPLSLAAIIGEYLNNDKLKVNGNEKLLSCLDAELKSLVDLEDIKASLVKASPKDLDSFSKTLVQLELCRLFNSDIDGENLLYLNSIFQLFPNESWLAVQTVLQLRSNGEGSLTSKAPTELWKIVLSPVQTTSNYCSGQQNRLPAKVATPVFELLCQSIFRFQPSWLPRFLELAQQQSGFLSSSSWTYGVKESSESLPLYKRTLAVLPCKGAHQDLEVEILLCSQRPNAVMQALHILIGQGQWGRVIHMADKFCRKSPLLNKEIFITLLNEVSQHRDLDPYLDLLWTLCPEDMTVTAILNIVLRNLPSVTQPSAPFQDHSNGSHLTIGHLKPLLNKVLQRETKSSERYADILHSPTVPPPTPPRLTQELARVNNELDIKDKIPNVFHVGQL